MGRGLGSIQRGIIQFLEKKAIESRVASRLTIESYANVQEITTALNESSDTVCQALSGLIRRGSIRIYPNNRKRNRYYGSSVLPYITENEVKTASASFLNNYQ